MPHSLDSLQCLTEKLQKATKETARMQNELNSFFELCPDMLVIAENGIFKRVNAATALILGYSEKELLNTPYIKFVHPNDVEATMRETNSIVHGQMCLNFKNRYRCKDGTYKWIEWKAAAAGGDKTIYACGRDITIHKETSEKFELAFHYAPIGMALVSTSGKWLKVNDVLCKIVGYSRDELLNTTFQAITHPEDLEMDLKEMFKVLSGETNGYNITKRYIRKDGGIVQVDLNVIGIQNAINETQYFISHIMVK